MSRSPNKSLPSIIGEGVAIGHFLIAHLVVLIGFLWPDFASLINAKTPMPGLEFLYSYIDAPAYMIVEAIGSSANHNVGAAYAMGEAVIAFSSIAYGLATYSVSWLLVAAVRG